MRSWLVCWMMCWLAWTAVGQERLRIGLFEGELPVRVTASAESGAYEWVDRTGRTIAPLSGRVTVALEGGLFRFEGREAAYLYLRPTLPGSRLRMAPAGAYPTIHTGNVHWIQEQGRIRCILETDLETYLQGVLSAESGKGHHPEYYRAQAIVSRTYTVQAMGRHRLQGFDLCDDVHCQAYHGNGTVNDTLRNAVSSTVGQIVVDRSGRAITAAFHSNCGGHTQGAENVWQQSVDYLVGVPDTFCLAMPHAQWTKTVAAKDWHAWLREQRHDSSGRTTFLPNERINFLPDSGTAVRAAAARSAFGLQSSYFVTVDDGLEVRFMGQGFGHGVGLCQEGAMERARNGATASDILHHYYSGVRLTSLHALNWFSQE